MFKINKFEENRIFEKSCKEKLDTLVELISVDSIVICRCNSNKYFQQDIFSFLKKRLKNVCTISSENILKMDELNFIYEKNVKISMKEQIEVVEGQVTFLSDQQIKLKTQNMESVFGIGPFLYKELEREKICVGDIITIHKDSGLVLKNGNGLSFLSNANQQNIADLPLGDCFKTKTNEFSISLSELIAINANNDKEEGDLSTREMVENRVDRWIKESKVNIHNVTFVLSGCEKNTNEMLENLVLFKEKHKFVNFVILLEENINHTFFEVDLVKELSLINETEYIKEWMEIKGYTVNATNTNKILNFKDFATEEKLNFLEFISNDKHIEEGMLDEFLSVF
ncbi:RVB2 [Ecytonucleospora hepatopenaei]|uniref:RuvB-like helicase n=1 Tax=Ecytonucleospora hepatopenaei TaxID=646526 RepID=A0A1W0E739_9MICR|nr:RVB2 [Ecytonucleospora hepatopenaei]